MAVLEENFTALETEVAEVVNILFELLSEEDPSNEAASLDGQIERYAQQVERIGLAAETAGFMALRELCVLLQEKLVELAESAQGRALSEDERLVLEEWPTLVVGYLESPQDDYNGEALIQHLQNPAWVNPLAAEDAELIKAMLTLQADESAADVTEAAPLVAATDGVENRQESIATAEQEPLQTAAVDQTIESTDSLATEQGAATFESPQDKPADDLLAQPTVPDALEIAVESDAGSNASPADQLVTNTDELSSTSSLFADTLLQSLEESQAQQTIEPFTSQDNSVAPEISEVTGEPVSSDAEAEVTPHEHVVDSEEAVSADQQTTDSEEAVMADEHLADAEEVVVADERAADAEEFVVADEQGADVPVTSPEAEIALLISILESVPEQATAAETSEYIERYGQQVERIGIAAGLQMPGLQDVCLLFQEALVGLRERGDVLNDMERELLESWPMLVMSYLESPTEPETCAALVNYLQSPVWPTPLTPQDAENLQSVLLPQHAESIPQLESEVETPGLVETLDTAPPGSEPVLEPSLAESTVAESQDDHHEPPFAEAVSAQSVEEAVTDEAPESSEDEDEWDDTGMEAGAADASQELVEILCAEIEQLDAAAQETLELAVDQTGDAATRHEALTNYAEEMERFTEASEAVGLTGLQQACAQIHLNLLSIVAEERPMTSEEGSVLAGWPVVVLNYLHALTDQAAVQGLVQYLQDAQWPHPLSAEAATALTEALTAPSLAAEVLEVEARQKQAVPDDVSLALPEDVNPELLDSLLQELPSQTAEFSTAIQRLAQGEGNLEDVDVAQRIAHTVKGAGNTVGVRGIANLTHHMEDILLALSKHKKLPTRTMSDTLLNAADCLETMSEALVGISAPPPQALEVLQEVLDWANRIDREGIPTDDDAPAPRKPKQAPTTPASATTATPATTEEAPSAEHVATPMLRVPATMVDNLLRLVGESIILTGQIQERINKTMQHSKAVQEQNLAFQQLTAELEQLVDVRGVSSPLAKATTGKGDFDPLELEQYNELNTVTHRLLEVATDSQEFSHGVEEDLSVLDALLVEQGRSIGKVRKQYCAPAWCRSKPLCRVYNGACVKPAD
ncbi:MAG: Hpt domain-containing protein [Candidatus Competibacteraceae bacterium]